MKVYGITGGVGCGKSKVLAYLEERYHMYVIQADLVSHDLIRPEGACYPAITELLGKDILDEDGCIIRSEMAARIFADKSLREAVNEIIHPGVKREIERRIRCAKQQGYENAVVEAALLLEAHYEEFIDEYWYIYAEESVRRERLRVSRGYSEEKITGIMKSQLSEQRFREGCRFVIDNSGAFADTKAQIDRILRHRE